MNLNRMMIFSLQHKKIIPYLIFLVFIYIIIVLNNLYDNDRRIRMDLISRGVKVCVTPNYKPMDADVKPFMRNNYYRCPKVGPDLIAADLTTIYQIPQVFINYSQLNCYYKTDDVWHSFVGHVDIKNHFFVHVKCMHLKKIVYQDYLPLVPKAGSKLNTEDTHLNVLVLLIGSVGRLAFHRNMQMTMRVLKKLHAIEFKNMNVVGLQKEENLIALSSSCQYYYPNCKRNYIWDLFKEKDYATAYIEDAISHNNIFPKGFVDYNWTHGNQIESLFGSNWSDGPHPFCVRNKKTHSVLLEYSKQIFERGRRSDVKTFTWLYTNAAQSREDKLMSVDGEFANYLFYLYRAGYLNETVVFFMSDQGRTFGPLFLNYERAFMESLNPFLYVLLPPWFKEVYENAYNNLIINSNSLISHLNIQNTLKSLINLNTLTKNSSNYFDLFQKIPENGHFTHNGISAEFKPCLPTLLSIDNQIVLKSVMKTLQYINNELRHTPCRKLTLNYVESARVIYKNNNLLYIVRFYALQGSAHFESYVDEAFKIKNIIRLGYDREKKCVVDTFFKKICVCMNN